MQKKIARIVAVALMLTVGMTFTLAIPEGADAATAKPSKVATLKVKSTGYNSIKVYWTKTKNAKKCEGLVRMFLRFRFCGIVCCVLYRFPFPQSDL